MDSFPDMSTEAKCRELLDRYPDNVFVKWRLASLLQSQGHSEEASEILPNEPTHSLKYDMGLLTHNERIRQCPEDAAAYLKRGIWHRWNGSFGEALSDYDTSIMIDPETAYAFCARAELRAACPDERFRDGQMSVEDARTALELAGQSGELIGDWRRRLYLQALAAAHAENDDFREAIVIRIRALDLAVTNRARSDISLRLEEYRSGNPIRDGHGLLRSGFKPPDDAATSPAHPADPPGR